ncbi:MAG: efflux RND transporter permease subunit, partial [Acidobacteriota bacterium]
MRALIRWIVDHPLVTILGLAIGGLMGAYGAGHMSVDIFPRLNIPVVNIITHDPGAAPQDVELLISRPIGDQMRGITGVQQVRSTSFVGISVVTVQFNWNTSVQQARQLVTARLARVRAVLPQGAAASRLMDVNGVSRVEILGGDRRAFVVRFRPDRLASLNLSVSGVVRLLRANNRAEVAGYLSRSSQEYLIRGDAPLMTVKEIESLPLERAAGKTVLLGQVARVNDWRAPRHYSVLGNGVPAVAFYVLKQPGASTLQVAKKANRLISNLHGLFPPGTQIRKFYDQSEMIGQAREEILRDLLFGALLAVLVLFFFMGTFRPTLVVAATIPLTLLTTLAVMRVSGQGLNMITMSALVLGIGMFVDDAIVVSENIFRHRQLGKAPAAAALDGAVEIAGPDASGTFTTVAAYLPLILVTGLAGVFLRPFGLTISAGLLASLLISLTFIPLAFSR